MLLFLLLIQGDPRITEAINFWVAGWLARAVATHEFRGACPYRLNFDQVYRLNFDQA